MITSSALFIAAPWAIGIFLIVGALVIATIVEIVGAVIACIVMHFVTKFW